MADANGERAKSAVNVVEEPEPPVQIQSIYNRAGTMVIRYRTTIEHSGLGEFRELSSSFQSDLLRKVEAQRARWRAKWQAMNTREQKAQLLEENREEADDQTQEARQAQEEIEGLLVAGVNRDPSVKWDSLKNHSEFKIESPAAELERRLKELEAPSVPSYYSVPREPHDDDAEFQPKLNLLDKAVRSLRARKEVRGRLSFERSHASWVQEREKTEQANAELKAKHEIALAAVEVQRDRLKQDCAILVKAWEEQKRGFCEDQAAHNRKIDDLKDRYRKKDPEAVEQYCRLVLDNSPYPDTFPSSFEIDYNADTRLLIVEFSLPPVESLPTLVEVKYVASRGELKESHLSDVQLAKVFDMTMYRITLRTLYELFVADKSDAIDAVVFNGWVDALNKATGKRQNNCILSIQVSKTEFLNVDLKNVDPKACFRNFKGVGSSKLSSLAPIAPIIQISRDDKRFVAAKEVADRLDEGFNLAAMDWEDFEHLIREIFEAEFSVNGGEVKVTQASRDGGVDAVAFDPDPIRGGKIVIQAKRYTNTVGVSAVRDLYGTVMNEGATKGILVTTADYGPDAYEFARGKPLTLLSGSNLLHLLEKHGHKARIDLAEARKLMMEQQREHS